MKITGRTGRYCCNGGAFSRWHLAAMVTTVGGLVNSGYTSGSLGRMLNRENVEHSPARSVL